MEAQKAEEPQQPARKKYFLFSHSLGALEGCCEKYISHQTESYQSSDKISLNNKKAK